MSFHYEHFLRHSALSNLENLRKSPRAIRAWPVYDGHQSPHFGVVGWLDRAIGQLPVTEVPTTHVLQGPMQEGQVITMSSLSVVSLHGLPVFADVNGSLQSDVISAPAVQQPPGIERLRPLADYWAMWQCLPEIWQWVLCNIQ